MFVAEVHVDAKGIIRDGAPIVKRFTGQPFSNLIRWAKPTRVEPLDDLIAKHKTVVKPDIAGHNPDIVEHKKVPKNRGLKSNPDTIQTLPDIADAESGKVVHCKREAYDVYIGRPGPWGNPFSIGKDGTREEVIQKYEAWIRKQPELLAQLHTLKGKVLGCWCAPKACHGDVLLKLLKEVEGHD